MATSLRLLEALSNRFHLPFQVSSRLHLGIAGLCRVAMHRKLRTFVSSHQKNTKMEKKTCCLELVNPSLKICINFYVTCLA